MSRQTDLFNPIEANGKTRHWNKFYGPYLKSIAKKKKEQEIARIEAQAQISILIKHTDMTRFETTNGTKDKQ